MKTILSILLSLIISVHVNANTNTKKIDKILNDLFDKDGPGGVALVVKDGKTVYREAFGMANLELGVKMTPDFIFRVGSITKQFTAAAIIQLAEHGKLDLKADINQYINDFSTDDQKITIENLLTHTSGIPNFTANKAWKLYEKTQELSSSELVELINNQPLIMTPGEREEYSNSNYVLLGRIIEIISGQSYQQYLHENIFKPLGMNNTSYDSPKRIIKNRAYGYAKNSDGYENADYISMSQPFAAGAIISTVDDLAHWQAGLFSYQIISEESLAKASIPFVLNNGDVAGYGYSWGFNGWNTQGEPTVSYNGAIDGFSASTKYIPNKNIFVAILANNKENYPKINTASVRLAAIALGKPYEWQEINLKEETLLNYEGIYTSEKYGDQHIVYENNELKFYQPGGKKLSLYPFKNNKFFFKDPDFLVNTIELLSDANASLDSIKMTSSNIDKILVKTDKKIDRYQAIKVTQEQLKKYVGKYQLAPNFYLNIFIENNTLHSQATGQNINKLRAYENTKFVSESNDVQHIFNYDINNEIKDITIIIGKDQYQAKKIE